MKSAPLSLIEYGVQLGPAEAELAGGSPFRLQLSRLDPAADGGSGDPKMLASGGSVNPGFIRLRTGGDSVVGAHGGGIAVDRCHALSVITSRCVTDPPFTKSRCANRWIEAHPDAPAVEIPRISMRTLPFNRLTRCASTRQWPAGRAKLATQSSRTAFKTFSEFFSLKTCRDWL